MDTIPEELLAEIFGWCELDPFPKCSPFRPETIPLLNVCHAWTRIALSTPSLWTSVAIRFNFRGLIDDEEQHEVPHFLALSKRMPLDVQLEEVSRKSATCLGHLIPEMNRMRSIVLKFLMPRIDIARLVNAMDVSEKLTLLVLNGRMSAPADPGIDQVLGQRKSIHLPRLRDFTFEGYDRDDLPFMSLPALETLRLSNVVMQFPWIHPLVCSASQTLRQIIFMRSIVLSLPSVERISVVPQFPSVTSFELFAYGGRAERLGPHVDSLYPTFLIQNITSSFSLHFRGCPNPFLDIGRSASCTSLNLILRFHPDTVHGPHQLATVEDEQLIRQFLGRFPALRVLTGGLIFFRAIHYRRIELGEEDLFLKVFEERRKLGL